MKKKDENLLRSQKRNHHNAHCVVQLLWWAMTDQNEADMTCFYVLERSSKWNGISTVIDSEYMTAWAALLHVWGWILCKDSKDFNPVHAVLVFHLSCTSSCALSVSLSSILCLARSPAWLADTTYNAWFLDWSCANRCRIETSYYSFTDEWPVLCCAVLCCPMNSTAQQRCSNF